MCVPSSYHVTSWLFSQHPSGLHHFRSVYQQGAPSFLETGNSPTVPGPDCTEDARRCPNGIVHAGRLVSAGQYADVHCRATEQFHAIACLFFATLSSFDYIYTICIIQESAETSLNSNLFKNTIYFTYVTAVDGGLKRFP